MSDIQKPSTVEDEYFVKEDAEKKRRLAQQVQKATALEDRQKLRDLHYMHCPKCGMEMHTVPYGGKIDVDVCFACGGIFLDKGELEQLVTRETKGVMSSILNWFREETKAPGK